MSEIKHLVIAGGGTAGWMAASFLSNVFPAHKLRLTLVESAEIGTVGVGEATIPTIVSFNMAVGADEAEFMAATQATIKLGIRFHDWWRKGHSYLHPFGQPGEPIRGVSFHAYWLKARAAGYKPPLTDFWLNAVLSDKGRFTPPSTDPRTPQHKVGYAYHFDAGLYAAYLRGLAEKRGVTRVEGTIREVGQDGDSGVVTHLDLGDGRRIDGDFFIDCTGFRALLIGDVMKEAFDSWQQQLPVDRAVAVPCARSGAPRIYTEATARQAGWQWRINLRHRTGNGHVYVSDLISDDEATATLLANLDGEPLAEPRILKFTTGRRRAWRKNVVAIGLSAGFLEPLESTSIQLIYQALIKLAATFPLRRDDALSAAHFNAVMDDEYVQIRDFLVYHYHANEREGEPLWDRMRHMTLPDSLRDKIALFRERGLAIFPRQTLFQEQNWLAVMLGQGLMPESYDPLADIADVNEIMAGFDQTRRTIEAVADRAPLHEDALRAFIGH